MAKGTHLHQVCLHFQTKKKSGVDRSFLFFLRKNFHCEYFYLFIYLNLVCFCFYLNHKGNPFASDHAPDVRGLSLKLFGVSGTKAHEATAETSDFVAITSEVLFMQDFANAVPFFETNLKNSTLR